MRTYRTSEIAAIIGIHPNTVRLYEKWQLIPKPERQPNGYRIFTDLHIEQFKIARLAFQMEVLQNGLRNKMIQMVKASATGNYDMALALAQEYFIQVKKERLNAEEATEGVREILSGAAEENTYSLRRKEVSEYLNISMDTLRNWEMNGLLKVKRKQNGYRVYTDKEIRDLKIIRSLRCANYSLEAILHMLQQVSENPSIDIKQALDTPKKDADIVSACDHLITSLSVAEDNVKQIICMLERMKTRFL